MPNTINLKTEANNLSNIQDNITHQTKHNNNLINNLNTKTNNQNNSPPVPVTTNSTSATKLPVITVISASQYLPRSENAVYDAIPHFNISKILPICSNLNMHQCT